MLHDVYRTGQTYQGTEAPVPFAGADGRVRLEVPLLGRVNGVNAAAAYLAARRLGLDAHLSAQRSNGLRAMIKRIRDTAGAAT